MTFRTIPITSITVNRAERQRRELKDIPLLADSIARSGLINPIVIDENNILIAGERRLSACLSLGWTSIPVQYFSDLTAVQKHLVELEENTKRLDLPWQEQCAAVLRYHELRSQTEEGWTQEKTAEAIGVSPPTVRDFIAVAKQLHSGDTKVVEAQKYSTARGITKRRMQRAKSAEVNKVLTIANDAEGKPRRLFPIVNEDFTEWCLGNVPKFNLIHCDFPYGVNADRPLSFQSNKSFESYADNPEVYWHLLETFLRTQDNFCSESAHLIFWFSMNYYTETVRRLTEAGWAVQPHPLVWLKTTGGGICPDPQRQPTRVYETALFASRGDRHIVRTVRNAIAAENTKLVHQSEKPKEMLRHFMRMVVDEYSTVLDPTAGSGNALAVARELGATELLGLERDPVIFAEVKTAWEQEDEN